MSDDSIQSILREDRKFEPPRAFTDNARIGPAAIKALRDKAELDHSGFWCELANAELDWQQPFSKGLDDSPFLNGLPTAN